MAQDIIDQLSSLVSEFITRTTAKVRKDFREILITILILHISLPGRINFTQMGRFSNKSERTYRNRFECEYDWGKMNMELAKNMINRSKQKRLAVVVDASFLGKAGKKTPHVGLFWSGVNQAVKHGIELHSWAIVDADSRLIKIKILLPIFQDSSINLTLQVPICNAQERRLHPLLSAASWLHLPLCGRDR